MLFIGLFERGNDKNKFTAEKMFGNKVFKKKIYCIV